MTSQGYCFWHERGAKLGTIVELPQWQVEGLKTAERAFEKVVILGYRSFSNLPEGVCQMEASDFIDEQFMEELLDKNRKRPGLLL